MLIKTCIECGATKPLEQFWIHRRSVDGYSHRCGTCMRSRVGFGRTKGKPSPSDGNYLKHCPRCRRALPLDCFDSNRANTQGTQAYCKECLYRDKPSETERTCTICKETSPISNFHKCGSGHQSCCRACNTERARVAKYAEKYGITVAEYDAMNEAQKGLCYLCGKPEKRTIWGKIPRLSVDHNHATGQVRRLLCYDCNQGIGLFKEDTALLARVIAYLNSFSDLEDPTSVLFPRSIQHDEGR